MLLRSDPFRSPAWRELDRLTEHVLGTASRPALMPMDAWGTEHEFFVEMDLPGVNPDDIDLDIERNVLTVRAERKLEDAGREMLANERPRGVFSRQLVLGDNLDLERLSAECSNGVLRVRIPVAERAKPRKIKVSAGSAGRQSAITDNQKIDATDSSKHEKQAVNA